MKDHELIPLILEERDIACERCGYNLRGVREPSCPECGEALAVHPRGVVLAAGLENTLQGRGYGLYQLALAGFLVPTVVLGTFFFSLLFTGSVYGYHIDQLVLVSSAFAMHAGGLIAVYVNRDRVRRLRRMWWVLLPVSWWWFLAPVLIFAVGTVSVIASAIMP